jgi:pimeloyl-ACP methyl ester carboxylesterase
MKSPVLVLLHGYPFDHTMWYGVIASLGSGTKVLAPDLPGFGQAPVPEEEPSLDLMADAVVRVMDENEVPKAVVAGMSMGGYVALAFAEKYPTRLAGLGLINTQAAGDTEEVRTSRRAMIARVKNEGVAPAAQALTPKLFAPGKATNPDYLAFPNDGATKAGVAGVSWALEAMARRPDRMHVLKELKIPVLVLHSSEDQIISVEKGRAMCQAAADGNFVLLKGVGHCSPIEAPEVVAQALRRLVEESSAPAEPVPAA